MLYPTLDAKARQGWGSQICSWVVEFPTQIGFNTCGKWFLLLSFDDNG